MTTKIKRIDAAFDRYDELLVMIRAAFAYMDGRIDPPSSAHRLTTISLREKSLIEIAFVALHGDRIVGCIFCKPEPTCLYVGKLAVLPESQGRGIGRLLLAAAEGEASVRSLHGLRLETRIELTANHACFAAWGFEKTAENRHPGFDRTTSIEMTKRL